MELKFFSSCPKDLLEPESNEDKFALSVDNRRYALCDGASESYDSKSWARILAEKYVADRNVSSVWVESAILDYELLNDPASLSSWSKQAAYERGSFSTLLGIEFDSDFCTVEVFAVGDSLAILVDAGSAIIDSWPYADPERFKEHPTLLSTLRSHNSFVGEGGFWTECGKNFSLKGLSNPILLCMTDALGEWALKEALSGGAGLSKLVAISSEAELNALVVEERAARRMRIDDSTLLIFSLKQREVVNGLPFP